MELNERKKCDYVKNVNGGERFCLFGRFGRFGFVVRSEYGLFTLQPIVMITLPIYLVTTAINRRVTAVPCVRAWGRAPVTIASWQSSDVVL